MGAVALAKKRESLIATTHSCVGSVISSVLMMLVIKHLLNAVGSSSYFNMAVFCTMCHQIFAAAFTRLLTALGKKNPLQPDRNEYFCAALAFTIGGSIVFNNWAVALLPLSTCQLFKLLCIPVIASAQYLLYRRTLPARVVGALFLLVIGVGQATITELSFQALPSLVASVGLMLSVESQVLLERYNDVYPPLESLDVLQVTSSYIGGFLAVTFAILEVFQRSDVLSLATWSVHNVAILNVTCILAVATNYYAYQVIQNCSAVTFQVVGNVKTVMIIAVSFCFGSSTFTTQNLIGIVLALLGSALYSYFKITGPKSSEYMLADTLAPNNRPRSKKRLWICMALVATVITVIASVSAGNYTSNEPLESSQKGEASLSDNSIAAEYKPTILPQASQKGEEYKPNKLPKSSQKGEDAVICSFSSLSELDAPRDKIFKKNLNKLCMAMKGHTASAAFSAIEALNSLSPRNADKFTLSNDSIPILLLVHKRTAYLKILLEQLRNNYRINETMIVVVHDGLFKPVLDLIEKIDFCQVKQIFTPHSWSIQSEIGDPSNLKVGTNSLKLGWLWAHHQAFDIIRPDASHIAYIEDDFWVLPDYYQTLVEVRDYITSSPSLKDTFRYGFTVGGRPPSLEKQGTYDFNLSLVYNLMTGLTSSRLFWNDVKMAKELYCDHPSQNWDYTLASLWNWGIASRWTLATSPRLVHAGLCGGFHFSTDLNNPSCNINGTAESFQKWAVQLNNRNWQFDGKTFNKELAEQARTHLGQCFAMDEGLWGNETVKSCKSLF